jgi:hypothetical protein
MAVLKETRFQAQVAGALVLVEEVMGQQVAELESNWLEVLARVEEVGAVFLHFAQEVLG